MSNKYGFLYLILGFLICVSAYQLGRYIALRDVAQSEVCKVVEADYQHKLEILEKNLRTCTSRPVLTGCTNECCFVDRKSKEHAENDAAKWKEMAMDCVAEKLSVKNNKRKK